MTEQSQSTDLPVPASEWQAYVDAFTESLGQKPEPAGPPIAVFQLPDGGELRVIQLDTELEILPEQLLFVGVDRPNMVDLIYRLIPKDNRLREPYDIKVVGLQNGHPVSTVLRIATYRLNTRDGLVVSEGGVIHNPPFN
jgi:hypothetical protein